MSDELKQRGMEAYRRGDYKGATEIFQQAAASYEAAGEPAGHGEMLNNLGVIYRLEKEYERAEAALEQAEQIFVEIGDHNRHAQTLGNRADLRMDQDRREEAAADYRAAADLFEADGDGWKGAQVLRALSLLRLRQRRWLEAIMIMQESLETRPRLGPGQWLMKQLFGFALGLIRGG
jgi:tetratricopeptide (TPR) repeat protein